MVQVKPLTNGIISKTGLRSSCDEEMEGLYCIVVSRNNKQTVTTKCLTLIVVTHKVPIPTYIYVYGKYPRQTHK